MKISYFALLSAFATLNCFTPPAGASSSKPVDDKTSWNSRMIELKEVSSRLLPVVFDQQAFEKAKQGSDFEKDLKKFAELTHKVHLKTEGDSKKLPTADPSLRFVSSMLEENAQRALEAYKGGQKDYAQGLVKLNMGFCFSCHSASRMGPEFEGEEEDFLKKFKELDRADYLVTTRRFDEALKLYKSTLKKSSVAESDFYEWKRAFRNAMALAVRVKRDSKLALEIFNVAKSTGKQTNPVFVEELASLKVGIDSWKVQQKRKIDPGSEKSHLKHLSQLNQQAEKRKSFAADNSAEIEYLRLSASAHEFLTLYPHSKFAADALYYLGNAYDSLRGLGGIWMLQDAYWEACIYARPNSKVSQKCFNSYRNSVHLEHSGSRGTDLPMAEHFRLQKLRRFANSKKK